MNITLIDGRILPLEDIQLDNDGWNFSRVSSGERLTYLIRQKDKIQYFHGFDVVLSNDKIYQEAANNQGKQVGGPLPTNVTGIAINQLLTDPFAAPADYASAAVDKIKEVAKSPVTIVVAGIVVVVVVSILVSKTTR